MATAAKVGPQDLPPPGGYGPIHTERIPLRSIIGVRGSVLAFLVSTFGGYYLYYLNCKEVRRDMTEMRSARFAILPMIIAERDRGVLKQMHVLREQEADLMKDVEGWELGTYFGERIYRSLPKEAAVEPRFFEHVINSELNASAERVYRRFFT